MIIIITFFSMFFLIYTENIFENLIQNMIHQTNQIVYSMCHFKLIIFVWRFNIFPRLVSAKI